MPKKYPSELMFTEYPDLLTTMQVCEILGISRRQVYKMVDYGELYSIRIAGAHRFPKIKLIEFLLQHECV